MHYCCVCGAESDYQPCPTCQLGTEPWPDGARERCYRWTHCEHGVYMGEKCASCPEGYAASQVRDGEPRPPLLQRQRVDLPARPVQSRRLIAGATQERQDDGPYCAQVVAGLWRTVGDIYKQAARYQKRREAIDKTRDMLASPQYKQHPKRREAEHRIEAWRMELRAIDEQAKPLRRALERQWKMMPDHIIQFLKESGGWPQGNTPQDVARDVWWSATRGAPWPGGECPW